jgi:tRNA A-37 threonylcarbamoyl transferase component Bud32
VAIACPYCDHRINLKTPKPGRYRPQCPRCARLFTLVLPEQPGSDCLVRAIAAETRASDPLRKAPVGCQQLATVVAGPEAEHRFGFEKTNPAPNREQPQGEPAPPVGPREAGEYTPPRTDVRGYRIERELGRGGMGSVYLARQLSLDRLVALKVMSRKWANDPVFVARFTREAFAAAQLSHPNIVQIHDIGEVDGARFFSMEYVAGQSLAELLRKHGKLDPETAVGYVLQAARGLKHAHDRGMIHRDVKPDNLLLDGNGLVKVADLGLVKTPATTVSDDTPAGRLPRGLSSIPADMTGARIALGTPAYMSPEQCRDAASVDHRADIYSLGCTLYVLVTGRPPFEGTTAVELMTKHAYEPLVPPEQIVSRVPKELSAVIQRMMAKTADDRFPSMAEVVRTLEAWLGVRTAAGFAPKEEQIDRLEGFAAAFHAARTAVLRARVLTGYFCVTALAAVLLAFFGKLTWASGVVGMVAASTLAYFMIDGIAHRGALFTRVRQFVFGLGWSDWGIAAASLALFGLLLGMLGAFWIWVGFGLLGVGLAFGLRYSLDRRLEDERHPAVDGCEKLLRRLREQGLDEEDLRAFAAKFSGRHWEEFFEALFGYQAKLDARAVLLRGGAAGQREKHAAWREPLIAFIERVERVRKEARERRLLAAVELARLQAAGLAQKDAESKAKAAADAMVREADKIREAEAERVRVGHAPQVGGYPAQVGCLTRGASNPDFVFEPAKPDHDGRLVGLFVGPHVRATVAAVLLAGCGLWAHQNGLLPGAEIQAQASAAVEGQDLSGLEQNAALDAGRTTRPLTVDGVPAASTAWLESFNAGLAGLFLLGSLFYRGNTMSLFVLLGAAVAVVGHKCGIRTVEPLRDYHVALMLGSVLTLIGLRTARQ